MRAVSWRNSHAWRNVKQNTWSMKASERARKKKSQRVWEASIENHKKVESHVRKWWRVMDIELWERASLNLQKQKSNMWKIWNRSRFWNVYFHKTRHENSADRVYTNQKTQNFMQYNFHLANDHQNAL